MKKSMISLLLILGVTLFIKAQTFEVNWGPEYKKSGGMFNREYMLGADGKYFYVFSNPGGKAKILKFDYSASFISEETVETKVNKISAEAKGVIQTSTGNYVNFVLHSRKAGVVSFYYAKLVNGSVESELTEFYSLPTSYHYGSRVIYPFRGGSNDASESADYVVSPNKKYVAIVGSEVASGAQENVKVAVFNDELKLVWEKSYSIQISERNLAIEQFVVNDNGEVIMTAREYLSKEDRKKGTPKYKYLLFYLSKDGSKKHEIELDGDRVPWDTGIFPSDGNGAYIGGFYTSSTSSRYSADGVFFVSLVDGNIIAKTYPFTDEFLDGLQTRKQEKKGEGISSFQIDNMVRFADGSFSFIAEKYYITVHTVTSYNGKTTTTTTYTVYHSDELVIPRFSADGELLGINKVEKSFASRGRLLTSYSFFFNKDRIALVYSDYKTREERKELGKGRALYTDIAYIKGADDVEIENLFTTSETDMYYVPSQCLALNNGTHVVKVLKRKKYMYGIIRPF